MVPLEDLLNKENGTAAPQHSRESIVENGTDVLTYRRRTGCPVLTYLKGLLIVRRGLELGVPRKLLA